MSDCNVNEIMAAAGCYACLTPEQLEVIQTELLCRIYTNGGGGGTPGGLDQQVQFNDAGVFGGDAGLVYNKTTNLLTAGDIAISSMTAGSVLFAGAAGLVSQDNANLFWDDTNNRLGIGTNAPSAPLSVVGGALASTVNAINVTGTTSAANAEQVGARIIITPSGSAAQVQNGLYVSLSAGYTGSSYTIASRIENASLSTGTSGHSGGPANYGLYNQTLGVGSGDNVGLAGIGQNSTGKNIGVLGLCNLGGTTNYGVIGVVSAGTNRIGVLATLTGSSPTDSAALMADNGSQAVNIFTAKDNGTAVFSIIDGGFVGIGESGASITSHLFIKNAASADIGQIIKLAAVPTGDALRVTSSADAVLMRVDAAGNVGIGSVTPATSLHIHTAVGSNPSARMTDADVAHGITLFGRTTDTVLDISNYGGDSGGSLIWGLSDDASTPGITLWGVTGSTTPSIAPVQFASGKKNGATVQAIGATEKAFSFWNNGAGSVEGTELVTILGNGGTLVSGKLTVGGVATINQVTKILQGSDTHDFASVAAGTESAVRTVTITGAAAGDPVFIGLPDAASTPNIGWTVWVSAANTVSYKFYNRNTVAAVDLGNLTYKFFVHQL